MGKPKIPKYIPYTKPAIELLKKNGCDVAKDAKWPEILMVLSKCNLWHKVGDVFRNEGLVHSFDPTKIPQEIKQKLDYYKKQLTGGKRELTCQEVSDILDWHAGELCLAKSENDFEIETWEMTSEESLKSCLKGENPGTCSEMSRNYASESLYLNHKCPLEVAL